MDILKKKFFLVVLVILFVNSNIVYANEEKELSDKEFIEKYYFDVDLEGVKMVHFFRTFPFFDEKGEITPLGKTFLTVLTSDVWTWVKEPMIYIKDDTAYIHAVKTEGLNILFTLKKENEQWKVVKKETKKLPTVGSEVILEKAFLRAIGSEILSATKTYYGESRLFQSEKIIDIVQDEYNDTYDVTIQIVTFKGAHDQPFGFDTITLRLPEFKVIKYQHKDVSDLEIDKIPLATH